MPSLNLNSLPSFQKALSGYNDDKDIFRCPADQTFFYEEGSSYEWNTRLNSQLSSKFADRGQMPLLFDYEPFHGDPALPDSRNILYLDTHSEGI